MSRSGGFGGFVKGWVGGKGGRVLICPAKLRWFTQPPAALLNPGRGGSRTTFHPPQGSRTIKPPARQRVISLHRRRRPRAPYQPSPDSSCATPDSSAGGQSDPCGHAVAWPRTAKMLSSRLAAAASAASARARPRLRRALRSAAPHPSSARRSFSSNIGYDYSQNPVPVIRPIIWAATAVGTIYFTCAAFDVWQDLRRLRDEDRRGITFEKLEREHAKQWRRKAVSQSIFTPGPIAAGSPKSVWDNLSGPSKIMAGMTLVNVGFYGLSRMPSTAAQTWWASLGHTPALPWFRNSQLFTSMFAVSGVLFLSSSV